MKNDDLRKDTNNKNRLFLLYYIFIFGFYFLNVFSPNIIRPGVLASVIIAILTVFAIPRRIGIFDLLVVTYMSYNVFAILLTVSNGFPITVGIEEFTSSALPIMFFFLGRKFYNSRELFYRNFLIGSLFCYIIGLYWHFTLPDYFISFLGRDNPQFYLVDYLIDKRFTSFIGSTSMGMFAPISALISYYLLERTHQLRYLIMHYLSIVIALLSHQRASYLLIIIVIVLVNCKYFNRRYTLKIIAGEIIVLIMVSPFILRNYLNKFDEVFNVFQRFSTAISDRSSQWQGVTELGYTIILGKGLGSMSHRAVQYTSQLINDGAYFKLLGELGIVGFGLFILILIATFIRVFNKRHTKDYIVEATIVLLFLIQSIGTNGVFFQETAPLFWLSIGLIFSNETVNRAN